jgi:tRNA-dihydrouridine synthase A
MTEDSLKTVPPLSVAPMMDRTDRHFRRFLRVLTRSTLLYTEMVTTGAILRGERERYLEFNGEEHPLSLQLGGDDPVALAECAKIAEDWGYDEVNLNVGCPSDRVKSGAFGACLMAQPEKVALAVSTMMNSTSLPVTVKHRIGIDDLDRYEDMKRFVTIVADAGCTRFSVHARKAWLSGLSPKENRTIPPLRYEDVYRLKEELGHLQIEINGGIVTLDEAELHLGKVDAVMIGRAAYDNPWVLSEADARFFHGENPVAHRHHAIEGYMPYVEQYCREGGRLHTLTRHLHHVFHGVRGSRSWKRHLGEVCSKPDAPPQSLLDGLRHVLDGDGIAP